jgi:hypothetical protein
MRNKFLQLLGLAVLTTGALSAAATITIVNNDAPGEGFNDPTPATPVGGNNGATIGEQRLNVFHAAASIWGATLSSSVEITVRSQFDPQTCTATSAVLGSAGPVTVVRDAPGMVPGQWYHAALANKLTGADQDTENPDINATFNSNLGGAGVPPTADCGFTWYYGLDGVLPPGQINLLVVVLHELGHGIGFSTTTNGSTGRFLNGFPSRYDNFLLDGTSGLSWLTMTNAQRRASAVNSRNLVWTGGNVAAAVPTVLMKGMPELEVLSPNLIAGTYAAGAAANSTNLPATFLPNLTTGGLTGDVVLANDGTGTVTDACEAFPAGVLSGKIALVDRGTCTFDIKATNVAAAGAIGMIIGNNADGDPPPMVGPTIVPGIPSVTVTLDTATRFKNTLARRPVTATLRRNDALWAGADTAGRAVMNAPNPYQGGSSVSHWDPMAFRNLLMEPAINLDLTLNVTTPFDMTFPLLLDLGW